jgi:ElaA protein
VNRLVLHRSLAPDLPVSMLYALLRLRVEVFVVEQACPYQELDGLDLDVDTRHFWLSPDERVDDVRACLRLIEQQPGGGFRIGRVCVSRHARGRGAARRLIQAALGEVGDGTCRLDAQRHLTGVYAAFGFEPSGDCFTEDGIEHVPMLRVTRG